MTTPGRRIEQRGLWFEEFEPGVTYLHRPGRTVTEADNVLFTTLTMNAQALHLDAAWSATQPFGQRLVNSMFTLSTLVGQSVGAAHPGHHRREPRLPRGRVPAAGVPRRHALRRDRGARARPSASPARPGRRDPGAHRPQPARRRRRGRRRASMLVRMRAGRDGGARERDLPRARPAVLPRRPPRPVREGRRARRRRDPRPRGRASPPTTSRRARRALHRDPARPAAHDRPDQPGRHRRAERRPRRAGRHRRTGRSCWPRPRSAEQLAALAPRRGDRPLRDRRAGCSRHRSIAAVPNVVALMWGAEDLVASLGGTSSRHADGRYRDVALHARSAVLLAAAAPRQRRDRRGLPRHRRPRRPARRGRRTPRRRASPRRPASTRARSRSSATPTGPTDDEVDVGAARARAAAAERRGVRVRGPDGRRAGAAPRRARRRAAERLGSG